MIVELNSTYNRERDSPGCVINATKRVTLRRYLVDYYCNLVSLNDNSHIFFLHCRTVASKEASYVTNVIKKVTMQPIALVS